MKVDMSLFHKTIDSAKLFFTSDLHFNHTNYCLGVTKWSDTDNCRKFNSLPEMNDTIIDNINSRIPEDAILIHMGDFIFGDKSKCKEFRDSIKCKELHHCFGNHCDWMRKSDPGCFDSMFDYLEFTITFGEQKQFVVCSHYPMVSWRDMGKGSWMLHGHCHHNLAKQEGKIMDVGIDGDYFPYSAFDIRRIMNKKSIVKKDHH